MGRREINERTQKETTQRYIGEESTEKSTAVSMNTWRATNSTELYTRKYHYEGCERRSANLNAYIDDISWICGESFGSVNHKSSYGDGRRRKSITSEMLSVRRI